MDSTEDRDSNTLRQNQKKQLIRRTYGDRHDLTTSREVGRTSRTHKIEVYRMERHENSKKGTKISRRH